MTGTGIRRAFVNRSGRTVYNTAITYDTADRVTKCSFTNGSVAYTYDGIGRIATKKITAGSYTDTCTYGYLAGGYGTGSTTGLITSQSQGDETCSYSYNTLNRITWYKRSPNTAATTYGYNAIGQLSRTIVTVLYADRSGKPYAFRNAG